MFLLVFFVFFCSFCGWASGQSARCSSLSAPGVPKAPYPRWVQPQRPWTALESAQQPGAVTSAPMAAVGSTAWQYGGADLCGRPQSTLVALDMPTRSFLSLSEASQARARASGRPPPLCGHALGSVGSSPRLYMFGGLTPTPATQTLVLSRRLFVLDTASIAWDLLSDQDPHAPSPRAAAGVAVVWDPRHFGQRELVVVFGGIEDAKETAKRGEKRVVGSGGVERRGKRAENGRKEAQNAERGRKEAQNDAHSGQNSAQNAEHGQDPAQDAQNGPNTGHSGEYGRRRAEEGEWSVEGSKIEERRVEGSKIEDFGGVEEESSTDYRMRGGIRDVRKEDALSDVWRSGDEVRRRVGCGGVWGGRGFESWEGRDGAFLRAPCEKGYIGELQLASNTLYVFDSVDGAWTEVTVGDSGPSARTDHAMTSDGTKVFLYGGRTGATGSVGRILDDLWVLEAESWVWEKVGGAGSNLARYRHGLSYWPPAVGGGVGSVVVYGGANESHAAIDETWYAKTDSNQFLQVITEGDALSPRSLAGSTLLSQTNWCTSSATPGACADVVVLGGMDQYGVATADAGILHLEQTNSYSKQTQHEQDEEEGSEEEGSEEEGSGEEGNEEEKAVSTGHQGNDVREEVGWGGGVELGEEVGRGRGVELGEEVGLDSFSSRASSPSRASSSSPASSSSSASPQPITSTSSPLPAPPITPVFDARWGRVQASGSGSASAISGLSLHSLDVLPDGTRAVLFGGYDTEGRVADGVRSFHFPSISWAWIDVSVSASHPSPGPRLSPATALQMSPQTGAGSLLRPIPKGHARLYVLGGVHVPDSLGPAVLFSTETAFFRGPVASSLFSVDLPLPPVLVPFQTPQWVQPTTTGPDPGGRAGASWTRVADPGNDPASTDTWVLIGGMDPQNVTRCDVSLFSVQDESWTTLFDDRDGKACVGGAEAPRGRTLHAAAYFRGNGFQQSVIVHGGIQVAITSSWSALHDVWRFDLDQKQWHAITPTPPMGPRLAMCGHVAAVVSNKLWLVGNDASIQSSPTSSNLTVCHLSLSSAAIEASCESSPSSPTSSVVPAQPPSVEQPAARAFFAGSIVPNRPHGALLIVGGQTSCLLATDAQSTWILLTEPRSRTVNLTATVIPSSARSISELTIPDPIADAVAMGVIRGTDGDGVTILGGFNPITLEPKRYRIHRTLYFGVRSASFLQGQVIGAAPGSQVPLECAMHESIPCLVLTCDQAAAAPTSLSLFEFDDQRPRATTALPSSASNRGLIGGAGVIAPLLLAGPGQTTLQLLETIVWNRSASLEYRCYERQGMVVSSLVSAIGGASVVLGNSTFLSQKRSIPPDHQSFVTDMDGGAVSILPEPNFDNDEVGNAPAWFPSGVASSIISKCKTSVPVFSGVGQVDRDLSPYVPYDLPSRPALAGTAIVHDRSIITRNCARRGGGIFATSKGLIMLDSRADLNNNIATSNLYKDSAEKEGDKVRAHWSDAPDSPTNNTVDVGAYALGTGGGIWIANDAAVCARSKYAFNEPFIDLNVAAFAGGGVWGSSYESIGYFSILSDIDPDTASPKIPAYVSENTAGWYGSRVGTPPKQLLVNETTIFARSGHETYPYINATLLDDYGQQCKFSDASTVVALVSSYRCSARASECSLVEGGSESGSGNGTFQFRDLILAGPVGSNLQLTLSAAGSGLSASNVQSAFVNLTLGPCFPGEVLEPLRDAAGGSVLKSPSTRRVRSFSGGMRRKGKEKNVMSGEYWIVDAEKEVYVESEGEVEMMMDREGDAELEGGMVRDDDGVLVCRTCPPASYSLSSGGHVSSCLSCPSGGNCSLGGVLVSALPGWWGSIVDSGTSSFSQTLNFTACPSEPGLEYCAAQQHSHPLLEWRTVINPTSAGAVETRVVKGFVNVCGNNRDGVLCGSCRKGYSQAYGTTLCVPDEDCGEGAPRFVVLGLFLLVLYVCFLWGVHLDLYLMAVQNLWCRRRVCGIDQVDASIAITDSGDEQVRPHRDTDKASGARDHLGAPLLGTFVAEGSEEEDEDGEEGKAKSDDEDGVLGRRRRRRTSTVAEGSGALWHFLRRTHSVHARERPNAYLLVLLLGVEEPFLGIISAVLFWIQLVDLVLLWSEQGSALRTGFATIGHLVNFRFLETIASSTGSEGHHRNYDSFIPVCPFRQFRRIDQLWAYAAMPVAAFVFLLVFAIFQSPQAKHCFRRFVRSICPSLHAPGAEDDDDDDGTKGGRDVSDAEVFRRRVTRSFVLLALVGYVSATASIGVLVDCVDVAGVPQPRLFLAGDVMCGPVEQILSFVFIVLALFPIVLVLVLVCWGRRRVEGQGGLEDLQRRSAVEERRQRRNWLRALRVLIRRDRTKSRIIGRDTSNAGPSDLKSSRRPSHLIPPQATSRASLAKDVSATMSGGGKKWDTLREDSGRVGVIGGGMKKPGPDGSVRRTHSHHRLLPETSSGVVSISSDGAGADGSGSGSGDGKEGDARDRANSDVTSMRGPSVQAFAEVAQRAGFHGPVPPEVLRALAVLRQDKGGQRWYWSGGERPLPEFVHGVPRERNGQGALADVVEVELEGICASCAGSWLCRPCCERFAVMLEDDDGASSFRQSSYRSSHREEGEEGEEKDAERQWSLFELIHEELARPFRATSRLAQSHAALLLLQRELMTLARVFVTEVVVRQLFLLGICLAAIIYQVWTLPYQSRGSNLAQTVLQFSLFIITAAGFPGAIYGSAVDTSRGGIDARSSSREEVETVFGVDSGSVLDVVVAADVVIIFTILGTLLFLLGMAVCYLRIAIYGERVSHSNPPEPFGPQASELVDGEIFSADYGDGAGFPKPHTPLSIRKHTAASRHSSRPLPREKSSIQRAATSFLDAMAPAGGDSVRWERE